MTPLNGVTVHASLGSADVIKSFGDVDSRIAKINLRLSTNNNLSDEAIRNLFDKAFLIQCLQKMSLRTLSTKTGIPAIKLYHIRHWYGIKLADYISYYFHFVICYKDYLANHVVECEERLALIRKYVITINDNRLPQTIISLFFDWPFFKICLSKMHMDELSEKVGINEYVLRTIYAGYSHAPSHYIKNLVNIYRIIMLKGSAMNYFSRLKLIGSFMGMIGNVRLPKGVLRVFFDKSFFQLCLANMDLKDISKVAHVKEASLYSLRRAYKNKQIEQAPARLFLQYEQTIANTPMMRVEERLLLIRDYMQEIKSKDIDVIKRLFDSFFFTQCVRALGMNLIGTITGINKHFLYALYNEYIVEPALRYYEDFMAKRADISFEDRIYAIKLCVDKMSHRPLSMSTIERLLDRKLFIYALERMTFDVLSLQTAISIELLENLDIHYGIRSEGSQRLAYIESCVGIPAVVKRYLRYMICEDVPFEEKMQLIQKSVGIMKVNWLPARVAPLLVSRKFFLEVLRHMTIFDFAEYTRISIALLFRMKRYYAIEKDEYSCRPCLLPSFGQSDDN